MTDGPFHPREPSRTEVACAIAEKIIWAPALLALSTSIWLPAAMARAARRLRG